MEIYKMKYNAYSKKAISASKGVIYLTVKTKEPFKTLQKKGFIKKGKYYDFVLTKKGEKGVAMLKKIIKNKGGYLWQ
jgi:Mn-dependent DtxR family transcriptional regulator